MRSRSSNYKGCTCLTTHHPLPLLMERNTDVLMYYTVAIGIELTATWFFAKAVKQNLKTPFFKNILQCIVEGLEKEFAYREKQIWAMPFTAQWWCCHHPPINGAQDLHENLPYIGDAAFLGYQNKVNWTEQNGHNNNDHPLLNFPNATHRIMIIMSADIINTIYFCK